MSYWLQYILEQRVPPETTLAFLFIAMLANRALMLHPGSAPPQLHRLPRDLLELIGRFLLPPSERRCSWHLVALPPSLRSSCDRIGYCLDQWEEKVGRSVLPELFIPPWGEEVGDSAEPRTRLGCVYDGLPERANLVDAQWLQDKIADEFEETTAYHCSVRRCPASHLDALHEGVLCCSSERWSWRIGMPPLRRNWKVWR